MQDNSNELFPVVDPEGNVIGQTTRGEAHSGSKVLHPVVHLHVFNSAGELYLQHRPLWKDIQPDKWDTACGGHINLNESVEEALRREVREELGITDFRPQFLTRYVFESTREQELVNCYTTVYDGEICYSDELDGGRFFTRQEFIDNLDSGMFTPNFVNEYRKLFLHPLEAREPRVLDYLRNHNIPFSNYNHPEGKTIDEAKQWWHDDGSVHCKNIFMRNHKGNQHYLICLHCDHNLSIHDLEQRLKASLTSQGKTAPGKLSFASADRMIKYLGLEPGSVSPFGLINDHEHHVHLFLDATLQQASSFSFHPNDCRGTVVISRPDFEHYLNLVGNTYEYIDLY